MTDIRGYKLVAASQSKERLEHLLALTKIDSSDVITGVHMVLVDGMREGTAAELLGIDKKVIFRAIDRLSLVNYHVEKIKEIDVWPAKK